jgi:hypothetical protein
MWNHKFLVLLSKRAQKMAPFSQFPCPHAVKICQKEAILLSIYSLSLYNNILYFSHFTQHKISRDGKKNCVKYSTKFINSRGTTLPSLMNSFSTTWAPYVLSQSCNLSFLNSGARAGGRHARETGSQGLLRHQRR